MNRSLRKKANRGFALIASLLLMILLVVVAVGLLSLSTISLRSTSAEQARQTAEGNAKVALMLALGRLQETLGDDRRVTANASILEKSDSAVPRPQMVGVWESATSTLRNSPTGSGSIPYAEWKSSKFKSWLVSTSDPDASQSLDFGKAAVSDDSVGLFQNDSDGFDLQVEKIPMAKLANKSTSSMAYAVVQEADKAHISLPGEVYQNKTDVVQAPMHSNLALSGIATQPTDGWNERANKLISLNQTALDTGYAVSKESVPKLGSDYTVWSRGVIADVANGGLKTDMNLSFELPDATFAKAKWDGLTNPFYGSATGEGVIYGPSGKGAPSYATLTYENIKNVQYFPVGTAPTYQMIRSHYTAYKHLYESGGTVTAFERQQVNKYWKSAMPIYTAPRGSETGVTPVLDRVLYLLNLWADSSGTPWLVFTPVITLWNPYNVAIESKGYVAYPWMDIPMYLNFTMKTGNTVKEQKGLYLSWLIGADKTGKQEGRQVEPYFYCNLTSDGTNTMKTPLRLEPGEVRVFVPKETTPRLYDRKSADTARVWNMVPADINLLKLGGGVGIDLTKGMVGGPVYKMLSGDTLECNFSFQPDKYHYFNTLEDSTKVANPLNKGTIINEVQLFKGSKTFAFDSAKYTHLAGSKPQLVGVLETYHRTAAVSGELSDIAQTVNTRQRYINSTVSGATFLAGPNYNSSLRQGTALASLLQVTIDGKRGYYGGSNEANQGRDKVVMFDLPRQPLISLGAFQNADLSDTAFSPSNQFGNSWASPYLSRTSLGRVTSTTMSGEAIKPSGIGIFDHSWLLNDALWDKYFMSSIAPVVRQVSSSGTPGVYDKVMVNETKDVKTMVNEWVDDPANHPLRNSHHVFHAGGISGDEIKDQLIGEAGGRHAAEHMLVDGAFNVNSTNVAGWKAVLASMRGESFDTLTTAGALKSYKSSTATPFPRLSNPSGTAEDSWNGFRELTDPQIESLAKEIVVEVRKRGPFQSLAEFVNRRLDSGELGLKGALQSAIDRSGINDSKRIATFDTSGFKPYDKNLPEPYTGTGLAGWLTQADLLGPIASIITVRSDTFRIRGYGEVKDSNGHIIAKATCEAVVQRLPEWVDPTDNPVVHPNDLTSTANKKFGRRFEIVSFRMLGSNETASSKKYPT